MSNNVETKNTYVLIMAGGIGSRFWPKSRNHYPKQFIDVLGIDKSLLQLTYERFLSLCPPENIFFLTNEIYSELIQQQIGLPDDTQIISEPSRRNTAPCIAYAAFKIAGINKNANLVVAPSDHLILKENLFIASIKKAIDFASQNNALITLGIEPTRPDTGYGYIKYDKSADDFYKVSQFLEKPNRAKALEFVNSGEYLWNAGIFIWHVGVLLDAFKKLSATLYEIFERGVPHYNQLSEAQFVADNYDICENISIDYAIMEKADNVYTLPGDFGWSDLGTWASLHEVMEKDEQQYSFAGKTAFLTDTENCLIQLPTDKIAVIKGLSNYIVVDDGKVLLIYPKNMEQEVKGASAIVVAQLGEEYQ